MSKRRALDSPETSFRGYGEVLGSRCTHLEIKVCSVAPKWVYIFNRRRANKEIPVNKLRRATKPLYCCRRKIGRGGSDRIFYDLCRFG